jgi:copper oxidase (laccase) domain-containing protein
MPAFIHVTERPDVRVVHSTRRDGDFHPSSPLNGPARASLSTHPWTQLSEDHGVVVREVEAPGDHDGSTGDVLITRSNGAVLGMWVGDCVPVVLLGREWIAGVHAGWRGARDGVLDVAIDAMEFRGDPARVAVVGAHIGPCCYEFGSEDLDHMDRIFGPHVRSTDGRGRPALDMGALVRLALRAWNPDVRIIDVGSCTGCRNELFFSHRSRAEPQRHVLAVWREAA